MNGSSRVLVLGGGVGGLVAAVELRKKLPEQHRIVLVDREEQHLFAPSLLWLMIGLRTAENISRPLDLLKRKGIEVVHGEIERIDPESRQVVVDGTTHGGDYLVISLGAELAPETIPGLAEAGYNLYSLSGAEALREAFRDF
ncbi:MAG TPA: FAD/NAD(P)-binding oxidoreductase, partial [Vicinamibacteria bacterium]|nr:FAD/NAD(P)-binding oxidoreductase [Vicinamibacteria bacterium]